MRKDDFKIGDIVKVNDNTYKNLIGEIIEVNNFDIKTQCNNGFGCNKENERFKYVVKFEDGSICEFNSYEMFHCDTIYIFNSSDKDLHIKLDKNKENLENNTLTFAQLIKRAETVLNEEVWKQIESCSTVKISRDGCSISSESNFCTISSNDRFERLYETTSFSEAFKQYLKGKTIRPLYDENVEFNINPNLNQESIDNSYVEEIDQEWVVFAK